MSFVKFQGMLIDAMDENMLVVAALAIFLTIILISVAVIYAVACSQNKNTQMTKLIHVGVALNEWPENETAGDCPRLVLGEYLVNMKEPKRWIGNVLCRRGIHWSDSNVVYRLGCGCARLIDVVGGKADYPQIRITHSNFGRRQIVLPDMDAVRADLGCDVRIVIDDEKRIRSRSDASDFVRLAENLFPRSMLHAQLDDLDARFYCCLCAFCVADYGVCHHKIKTKIFHDIWP